MIRHAFPILTACALVAGCAVTTTPDRGPDDGGGAGDTSMSSNDAGGSPEASPPADGATGGGCAFGEPNDTRETATPIALNQAYTGLCVSNADATTDPSDFYVVTAPGDAAGGYVAFTITNVSADSPVEAVASAMADNGVMVDVNASGNGASISGWFTVSPGAKYALEVKRFGGIPGVFHYDLALAYTKITDAYEPNDTRAQAKPIALTTPIQASASESSANGTLAATDGADWYSLALAAGSATVKLTNVPADFNCDMELYDPSNGDVGGSNHSGIGANCEIDATNLAGGTYTLVVQAFAGFARAGSGAPPPSVTGDYTLTVTQ